MIGESSGINGGRISTIIKIRAIRIEVRKKINETMPSDEYFCGSGCVDAEIRLLIYCLLS